MMHYTINDILESGSRYFKNNFPVIIFFFQETHNNIWLVYFLGLAPIFQHCSHNLQISWTVLILYLIRTLYKNISYDVRHTHAQFLATFCPSLHALPYVCRGGVGEGKRADCEECDVGERGRAKNVGRGTLLSPECDPQHLPSNTACVRQKAWQGSNNAGWLLPFYSYLQGFAGLAACSLGSCFLLYFYGLWGIHKWSWNKTSSREFGDFYPLTQDLLLDCGCGKIWAFWIHPAAPWEILFFRKTISKLLVYLVFRCF